MDGARDAQPRLDGSTPDAGDPGECALPIGTGSFGPLAPGCRPRCSAATEAAYRACANAICQEEAMSADTTPGVEYTINGIPTSPPLDCFGCFDYSRMHCFSGVCPTEVDGYVDSCLDVDDPPRCDTALLVLNACLGGLTPAQTAMLDTCFASDQGPDGCF